MFIKADSLWVLLIYSNFIDRKCFYSMPNEFLTDTFPSKFWRNEQHFKFSIFNTHKTDRGTALIFNNYQMGNLP